ncbi:MAG TPA: carboxypeptidase-like regulatory domain-containing protein [Vicinamibacteria bacterium]|nr:carboxypeptidase-like regulatory domain-containing protein [Vicinamibacteria bacterium]
MVAIRAVPWILVLAVSSIGVSGWAQSFNGSISGAVKDPSGAIVRGAELALKGQAKGVETRRTSTEKGDYAFRNLVPGSYELRVTAPGFQPYVQKKIEVNLNADVRLDVSLGLGSQSESIEVIAETSTLSYDSGSHEDGITPETIQQLPLMFSGGPRAAATFAVLMPGVSTGGQANAYDARINGGMTAGDEAVLDGASMQQGALSQSGMVSILQDFPFSPDMVSEIKVVSSSYDAQYGSTTSGQIVAVTRSGENKFHGGVFDYAQNDGLNARQWGASSKSPLKKHNFGANIGGPMKIPGAWSSSVKTYFYVDVEGYRQTGGSTRPTLSIPSLKERAGDFSDWRDSSGNLIPIYDPATTRVLEDGTVVRDPFPGNIIPANRINPLAPGWLRYLPQPTNDQALDNYLVPSAIPDTILGDTNYVFGRFDTYIGQNDHVAISLWHQGAAVKYYSLLPHELAWEDTSDPLHSSVDRLNWDHTFRSNLLSHFTFGYLDRTQGAGCVDADAVDKVPQIAGVVSHQNPSPIGFSDGFAGWGCGYGPSQKNFGTRPTYVVNDLVTWIKGSHTIKAGFEYRNLGSNWHSTGTEQGGFFFGRGATALAGINSGSPIASFLLGAVDSAGMDVNTASTQYARQAAYTLHAGDTWKATSKLTLNYGLRWDYYTPSREKYDRLAFFDPTGPNPGAAGRPGRLAYAGVGWGEASYGAIYPEVPYKKAFAPRLGLAYALNSKTLVRAGWGIFYDRAFYPSWGGGMDQSGFNSHVAFSSTLGGLEPAFFLQDGFPQDFKAPPFISSDYRNGQDLMYRPLNANERPRSQQWNLTVDREFAPGLTLGLAYVGSHGTRMPSKIAPLNALNPSLLSLGSSLNDEFQEGQTSLHGVPEPYPGWREQMQGCPPSLAQALLPYPQYCSSLFGLNENQGESTYNSLQAKLEKRFSHGTYFLLSYTLGKIMTSASDFVQSEANAWSGTIGVISPYEKERNWAPAADDVTHVFSVAMVWDIPVGRGRKWVDHGGAANAIVGGWQLSTIFRYSSALPFFFRSSFCNVPVQFGAACIPSSTGNVFAQDKGSFDPNKGPLFNKDAFESVDAFNFYYGHGPRVSDIRGFSYKNQDLSLVKNTKLVKAVNLQLRFEAFNVWNWHNFTAPGNAGSGLFAFDGDIASPTFGQWNGSVSSPRVIQLAARLEF